jgi:hypothetical protein
MRVLLSRVLCKQTLSDTYYSKKVKYDTNGRVFLAHRKPLMGDPDSALEGIQIAQDHHPGDVHSLLYPGNTIKILAVIQHRTGRGLPKCYT